MNLLPNTDQSQIVDAARNFLSGEASIDRLRPHHGQVGNRDARLWPDFAELGFLGLGLTEADGGVGLGPCEEVLVYREFGRTLISPAVLGLTLGLRLAARAEDPALFTSLSTGSARVGLANPRSAVALGPETSGEFHLIEGREAAWAIAWSSAGAGLFRTDDFNDVEDILCMDSHLNLERAALNAAKPAVWVDSQVDPIELRALVLVAAYAVGVAEAARDLAADYAKVREQFGRPIGSFQAVKHRCADMAILAEAAWCQTALAAVALASARSDARFLVTAAKILATDCALKNAANCIQVHGAFGFTADATPHLYLKRAHVLDQLGGDLRAQRSALLREASPP